MVLVCVKISTGFFAQIYCLAGDWTHMEEYYRKPSELIEQMVPWLRAKAEEAGAKGAVVGLSGGIDSAVVALLLKKAFGENLLGVIMPCHSLKEDGEHARLLASAHALPVVKIDLASVYDALLDAMQAAGPLVSRGARSNLKPRLRMSTLYSLAQERRYLVCGTSNRVEWNLGYFTKHGDSGADILPLADLLKGEVRELGRVLGVPEPILSKPPSAGLWEGQTDEEEMGLTYSELDRFFGGQGLAEDRELKIRKLMEQSSHKRNFPPVFHAGSSNGFKE